MMSQVHSRARKRGEENSGVQTIGAIALAGNPACDLDLA
jgi:hypothetical protein